MYAQTFVPIHPVDRKIFQCEDKSAVCVATLKLSTATDLAETAAITL